jgi:hypothetical protein
MSHHYSFLNPEQPTLILPSAQLACSIAKQLDLQAALLYERIFKKCIA